MSDDPSLDAPTWEERMAARAARRAAEREFRGPDVDDDGVDRAPAAHQGHHFHLRGTGVKCTCGADFGVTCVAFSDDWHPDDDVCSVCGERGVVFMGFPVGTPEPPPRLAWG